MPRPRAARLRGRARSVTTSCSRRSATTIVSSTGAHASVRMSAHRSSTGSSRGAPVRRPPSFSIRSSCEPSARSSGNADVRDEVDTDVRERGLPAEVGEPAGAVAEVCEVSAYAGAVAGPLLGLEVARIDERFAANEDGVGVREPGIGDEPVAHREAGVGRPVRVALPARVLVGETAATHLVGSPEQRRRDPGLFLDVHVRTVPAGCDTASTLTDQMGTATGRRARRTLAGCGSRSAPTTRATPLKQHLVPMLKEWGHEVDDLGTHSEEPVDYPPICAAVARVVVAGDADVGIVLGGSGQGEQIAANKVRGVRAALCNDLYTAQPGPPAQRRQRAVDGRAYRRADARRRDPASVPRDAVRRRPPRRAGCDEIAAIETQRPRSRRGGVMSTPLERTDPEHRRHHRPRGRAPEHDDPADRVGELHVAARCSKRRARCSPTSTPRATRASATTAATTSSTRPRSSPATGRASCSAPSTRTCSRTRAPTRTWPRSSPCSSRATRSWACASTRAVTSPTGRRSTSAAASTTSSPTASTTTTETLDYDEIRDLAERERPKLIIAGATAYSRVIDFEAFRSIADEVDALLMVDAAHIAGLIAGGAHPSPVPLADVVTFTTHKTLRGPRAGAILCRAGVRGRRSTRRCSPGCRAAR